MASVACPGFKFAGLVCGIKSNARPDLGLIVAEKPVPTAGVFTTNQVRAAPVDISQKRVAGGLARAIIVNSGNTNACTGDRGRTDAEAMTHYAAKALKCDEKQVL